MSAQQLIHAPVRLLIAETSENSAQELDSMLRDAGISTRLRVTDLDHAPADIATADIMLCNAELPRLDLVLPQLALKAPHVPIILVNPKAAESTKAYGLAEGMLLGAADVVAADDRGALVLVFKRELAHACQGKRLLEARRSLKEVEQRCQLLLTTTKAAIAYVHEGMHIHANPGYLELFGFADEEALLGLPLMDLLSKDSADALKLETRRLRLDDDECTLPFSGTAASGAAVRGIMTLTIANYEGERCMQVTVREPSPDAAAPASSPVSAARTAEADTAPTADRGFGVRSFLDGVPGVMQRDGAFRAILVMQVDGYAKLQEILGLLAAETAAHHIFEVLKAHLADWPCARLSPHQFAFALAVCDRADLLAQVESLRQIIEASPGAGSNTGPRPTLSIGGVELGTESDLDAAEGPLGKKLDAAFAAAIRAENAGGNRIEVVTDAGVCSDPGDQSGTTLKEVNEAIDDQRFQLLFQPIISLRGDSEEHYEVFLRMLEQDGQVAPNEFLHTAVAHGVAGKIDRWMILQSIKMLSSHRAKGHSTRLTVTLTTNSIGDAEFPQWLSAALKAARLPSDALIFQVTERDAADHLRETSEFLASLQGMRCRSSLSRFGLVSDPMEMLRHLPVDFVKLDGSLVERLAEDTRRKDEITETIRDLQAIGKVTVVPMVESAGVLSALWQAGANYIQGHYLQEPTAEMNFDFSSDD
jgi:multidomain signaling protein FimX